MKKALKRPNEAAMEQILQENQGTTAELALRLAWNLGLTREEMCDLKWSDISMSEKRLYLPDRVVPMEDAEVRCLENRSRTLRGQASEYIMTSDRGHTHMLPQSVSRVARTALDRGGLTGFTLVDLRKDYVIRLLERYDWPYVARVSGTSITTLYANYSEYYANGRGLKPERSGKSKPDEFKLWKILKAEGDSPEGLALWMAWKLGLRIGEIIALTWDQVDLDRGVLTLPDRHVPMGPEFVKQLRRVKEGRAPDADPHVLLTQQSQKPFAMDRLSRSVRTVLIRGGLEQVSLKDVIPNGKREEEDLRILTHAMDHGSVTRNDVCALLGVEKGSAYHRLNVLLERGDLIRVGRKCYIPGTVVPPEEQYGVIRAHLEEMGSACRGDLVELLRLDENQTKVILHRLVEEGKLVRRGQSYLLPRGKTDEF